MLPSLLRALAAAVRRDLAGFGPFRTNNFFLFVALLIYGNLVSGLAPVSAYPFLILLATLLFFPIASDPLEKIPAVRRALWPLTRPQRVALRIAALALNPLAWFAFVLLVRQGVNILAPLCGVIAAAVLGAKVPRFTVARTVPALPRADGLLIAAHLRAMLAVLDTWLALAVAVLGTAWRIAAPANDPAAWRVLAILAGVALSTQAQCGEDLDAARLRLLPLSAWRILLARDLAYLAITLLFTLALDPIAGLAFGLCAIAAARYPMLHARLRVDRWRFAGGRVLYGSLQMISGAALSFAGVPGLALALALWAVSLRWGGSVLAKRLRGIGPGRAPRG